MRYKTITKLPPEHAQVVALIHEYRGTRYWKSGKSVTIWSQIQPVVKSCWRIIQQFIGGRCSYARLGGAYDIAVHQCNRHERLLPRPYNAWSLALCKLLRAVVEYLEKVKQVPLTAAELRRLERSKKKKIA